MLKRLTHIAALLGLTTLAACGTGGEPTISGALFGTLTGGLLKGRVTQPAPITRASLSNIKGPILLAMVPSRGATGTLVLAQNNGPVSTYISADNISLLIRNNALIVGSRGFGDDLMAADITGLAPALIRGSGQTTRVMQFLNGEDQITTDRLTCTLVTEGREVIDILGRNHNTRKMREDCSSAAGGFSNLYWVADNEVWQSRQWISRTLGSITLQKVQ